MRAWIFMAVVAVLPACQMGLPAAQKSVENTAPVTVDPASAETNLAAAFEQAALAAQVDLETEKKSLFGFLKPKVIPVPAVLAGTDIEVVDGALSADEAPLTVAGKPLVEAPQADEPSSNLKAPPVQDSDRVLETIEPVKSGLGGLFGFLKPKSNVGGTQAAFKAPSPDVSEDTQSTTNAVPETAPLTEDDVAPGVELEVDPEAAVQPPKPLFGFLKPKQGVDKPRKKSKSKSKSTVALGEVLPFGTVGISCEARPRDMGKRVDKFPSSGSATWQIYDTDPSSIAPRTQFITGFKDGCARQVTAALVLFGSPSLHEVHRYAKARSKVSWSKADNSYESIKSKICGVGRKKSCPSGKVGNLEKHMAFVSVYKQFGDAKGWMELLLHDGKMVTQELR